MRALLAALLLVLALPAFGAGCTGTGNCYWIGGTGNTNSTTNWATTDGGATTGGVPGTGDNCNFTANSGTGTVTVNAALNCLDVVFSTTNITIAGSSAWNIFGSETLFSGMSSTYSGTKTYKATSGTKTITSAGVSRAGNITFDGVGGTWQLADALVTAGGFTLTNGTFNANNQSITAASFASSNSNTRTLTMGSGTWTVTSDAGTVALTSQWLFATTTNLTLNSGGNIVFNNAGTAGRRFRGGGADWSGANLKITAGGGNFDFSVSGNTLKDIDFTGFSGTLAAGDPCNFVGNLTLASGMTVVSTSLFAATGSGAQTLTSNGVSITGSITINKPGGTLTLADALTLTGTLTLTAGGFDAANKTVTLGSFSSNNTNARTISNWQAKPSYAFCYGSTNCTNGGGNTGVAFNLSPSNAGAFVNGW